jgi:hypothetical protein
MDGRRIVDVMAEDVESRMNRFEREIGELTGRLLALERPPPTESRHSGLKTAVTFATVVIVPILVAILGGWFALKSAGVR